MPAETTLLVGVELPYTGSMASGGDTSRRKRSRRERPRYAQRPPPGADEGLWLLAHQLSVIAEELDGVAGIRADTANITPLLHGVAGVVATLATARDAEAKGAALDTLRLSVQLLTGDAPKAVASEAVESIAERVEDYLQCAWAVLGASETNDRARAVLGRAAQSSLGRAMRQPPPLELVQRALATGAKGGRGRQKWSIVAELLAAGGITRGGSAAELEALGARLSSALKKRRKRGKGGD